MLEAVVSFDGGVKVSLGAELTLEKGKGLNFRVQICTNSSTSIGFGEKKYPSPRMIR